MLALALFMLLLGLTAFQFAADDALAQPGDPDRGNGDDKDKDEKDEDDVEEDEEEAALAEEPEEPERETFDLDEARAAADAVQEGAGDSLRSLSPAPGWLSSLPSFVEGEPPFRYTGTLPAGQGPLILIAGGMFVMGISTTWSMLSGRRLRRKTGETVNPSALPHEAGRGTAEVSPLHVPWTADGAADAAAAAAATGAKGPGSKRGWRGRRGHGASVTSSAAPVANVADGAHGRVTAQWREAVLTEFAARKMRPPTFKDGPDGATQVTLQGCAACARHEARGSGCSYEERILLRAIKARGLELATKDGGAPGEGGTDKTGIYDVGRAGSAHGSPSMHQQANTEHVRGATS